jgi:S-formylglutathione hydrolase FrmB
VLALTGQPLLDLTITLTLIAVVGVAALVWFLGGAAGRRRRVVVVASVGLLTVLGQGLAIAATAFEVNDQYVFYSSWADLFGDGPGQTAITTNGLLAPGEGAVRVDVVHDATDQRDGKVLIWLPPGYTPHPARPYPVVMFMPGQPGSPQITFQKFDFGATAAGLIATGRIRPFIGVFPIIQIAPPRDTECTNVPHSAHAEDWIAQDVPAFVRAHYPVDPAGPGWSPFGWSTGGFCAAKILLAHPQDFGSAVSFGGYYYPLEDRTTGDLFRGDKGLRDENNPVWLYDHRPGLRIPRMLLVAGKEDPETWPQTQKMLFATAGDEDVYTISFPHGGHNYRNYRAFLSVCLQWAARTWPA